MSLTAIAIAVLLPEALPLQAQERQQDQQATQTAQEGRRVHSVRRGDTLWDLASFYLSDPFLWPEIYRLNTMVVEDPHWIYPSEQLVLPGAGEIEVAIEEPDRVPGEEEVVVVPEVVAEGPPPELQELKSIFVPREATQTTLTYEPVPPLAALAVSASDFHRSGMLVELSELGPRGKVIDAAVPENILVKVPQSPPVYGRIYVSHPGGEPPQPGDRVLLSRIDRRVKGYGYVIRPTGIATIAAVHEDVSDAVIIQLFDRVGVGNEVTMLESFHMERGVFAEPVGTGPSGELVAFLDQQWVPSIEDIAFIDVGRDRGVVVGDEFEIYVSSRRSPEGFRLPEEHIATGRVVRVTEGTATLRVIEMEYAGIAEGLPVRLIRKMPS
ncbi:MAG: hypothetical protein AMS21_03105 [Gemmatimonas sp. SG8_38_2]|nr:MAG: hypothetical protein AMS21_03105 [Gemmatimonas sp. SG8_38_2]